MKQTVSLLLLALLITGCETYDSSEVELLKRDDPGFRNLMEVKEQVTGQIDDMKSNLTAKKNTLDEQIKTLKSKYQAEADLRKEQINTLNQALSQTREQFKTDFEKAGLLLESKKKLLSELNQAYANAQQVLSQQAALGLGQQELLEWQARVDSLKQRLAPLKAEINGITSQLALKKKKLKYL